MNYRRVPFAAHIKGNSTAGFMAGIEMSKVKVRVKEGAKPGWGGFFGWLAKVHPQVYNDVRVRQADVVSAIEGDHATGSVMGEIAATSPTTMQNVINTITAAGAAILPLVQQQKILKIQLERAKAGLAPLDADAYVGQNTGLNVGLNAGTQKTLLYLGGGLVGALVLMRLLKRR